MEGGNFGTLLILTTELSDNAVILCRKSDYPMPAPSFAFFVTGDRLGLRPSKQD
ncbi:MAG: hypothetical protein ACFFDN_49960 [Candidatus Hodarchaeota archaeon]